MDASVPVSPVSVLPSVGLVHDPDLRRPVDIPLLHGCGERRVLRTQARRSPDPVDRRRLVIEITPAGLAVVQELRTIIRRHEKAWLSSLSDADLCSYIEQLHRIQDSLAPVSEGGG